MAQELPERTVTVLFTDVVGSTDLTTSRGDEAAQEILRAQHTNYDEGPRIVRCPSMWKFVRKGISRDGPSMSASTETRHLDPWIMTLIKMRQ